MAGSTAISDSLAARFHRPAASDLSRRFFFLVDAIARDHEPTATQLERLASSYEGTADFLASRDEFADLLIKIHPHGSRQLGTMVRPLRTSTDGFDVDLIALLSSDARGRYLTHGGPASLINDFYWALKGYADYHGMTIRRWERCVTLGYADGMSADIAPVIEAPLLSAPFGDTHALIPDRAVMKYESTNPQGYAKHFDQAAAISPVFRERIVVAKAMDSADRAEVVPLANADEVFNRLLCRFVQLLKLHRNSKFSVSAELKKLTPTSVFVTTLAALAYARLAPVQHDSPLDLLLDMVKMMPNLFHRTTLLNGAEEWNLPNPSAPKDNLASAMNNQGKQEAFEGWIGVLAHDLGKLHEAVDRNLGNDVLISIVGSAFGARSASTLKAELTSARESNRVAGRVALVTATAATRTLPARAHNFHGD
ncbi:nucleotidyltransferase domain-containing protein [Burkholderia sp. LMG 32019]|uniref:nucleotidyltransferase domain-containing protein n=1 Tax=Burkholderia sp. LMG 32019 TaxID=3158173 RepID=UPI003C2E8B4C